VKCFEKILGRVLRLPYCKQKADEDLNKAFAFVASPNFAEAAQNLVDALVENGFNRQEAEDFIKPIEVKEPLLPFQPAHYEPSPKTITLSEVPDPEKLPLVLRDKIAINPEAKTITLKKALYPEEVKAIEDFLSKDEARGKWSYEANRHREEVKEIFKSPSERGFVIQIPVLCVKRDEQLELFEEDHLLEKGWDLKGFDPKLTDQEFNILSAEVGQFGEIDVGAEGRVRSKFIPELNRELKLIEVVQNWADSRLVNWLDQNLLFIELSPQDKGIFLTSMVGDLLDHRGMGLSQVVRKKFELRKIAEEKIKAYRKEARTRAYQELLFGEDKGKIVVSPERCFTFPPNQYPARDLCKASESFRKHYYLKVGELEDQGEEFLCAQTLDQMDAVEFWVRNLERQEKFSFWLQTSTDKFYPDFVCKLKDGRYLVVEYKGADRWSNDDSKEKRRLGELWALKSDGRCLFVMPKGKDWGAIQGVLKKNA
jgi:type III restriction enzyme